MKAPKQLDAIPRVNSTERHAGRTMSSSRFKTVILGLEALNALATTLYFYYFYFFMQEKFGFGAVPNLLLAAGIGLVYTFAAIYGGRFAHSHSYMTSLRVGFSTMGFVLLAGSQLQSMIGHVVVALIATVGMSFTWPALQLMISDKEPPHGLQKYCGIYNFTWATGSAAAYFIGGAIIESFGMKSVLLLPAGIHLLQLVVTFFLPPAPTSYDTSPVSEDSGVPAKPPANAGLFLKMAWLANPFAYLAINTVVPIIPTLAKQLHLSAKLAGFVCSIWFFVRAGSFILLWLWPKWHYRFAWLACAYAGLVAGFTGILMAQGLPMLILAQVIFGLSLGVIYYSSLFYSMDMTTESKAKHGGIHEAVIGAGCCIGPAIAAAALHFVPQRPNSGATAVSALLLCGLVGLFWLYSSREK